MDLDRYDTFLAAVPLLAVSGPAIETVARIGGGPGMPRPIDVVPLTLLGLLATCALIGHELFAGPVGRRADE